MKRKIVLWGTNEKDEKILVALQLLDKEGKINIYTFDEQIATEEFYNKLLNQWREGAEVEFPEGFKTIERPLNMSDSLLPDEVKVERTDIIARAQTEWHFLVLSAKLYQMYKSELEDLQETVEGLKDFDNKVWNEMKGFWSKVQEQVIEKNLFREHASNLKNKTNKLFDHLKALKKKVEAEFEATSAKHKETIMTELQEIEGKIEKGLGLKPIFEQLKDLQNKLRGQKYTRKDRDAIWNRLDKAFKDVKQKRFGDNGKGGTTHLSRHESRYNGLINAISKMEKSITRDKDDLKFQDRKIATTHGQLEMQIRQAKVKMVEERIKSKEEKLKDMYKTRTDLEHKIKKEKDKAEKRKQMDDAKAAAEAKIAEKVKETAEATKADTEKLEAAAAKIAEGKKQKTKKAKPAKETESKVKEETASEVKEESKEDSDSLIGAISATVGEAIENVSDTVKAVAEVVEDKVEETIKAVTSKDAAENPAAASMDKAEDKDEKGDSMIGAIIATVGESLEDVVDTVKAVAEVVEDKVEETIESFTSEEE